MTIKILGLAALMAICATNGTKAFANEEESTLAPAQDMMSLEDPSANHRRDPRWDPRFPPRQQRLVCYARNVTGRTFAAWGNWRTPARWVQLRALESCRRSSGFFRFTCRSVGCRRSW